MEIYKSNYPELINFNLQKIIRHYIRFGKRENRTLPPPQKITIITACSRPENIKIIKDSLNFDYIDKWIIVYDGKKVENIQGINQPQIKEHIFTDQESIKGTAQRNYALTFVENGFIYFLDDDNFIHPNFYLLLHFVELGKFYTFNQENNKQILKGNKIQLRKIDTSMFLIDYALTNGHLWKNDDLHDGKYISTINFFYPDKWVWINETLSYYNKLT